MSINPGVSQIYTTRRWLHLRYLCIPLCICIERLRQYMQYYDVAKLMTITKTIMIHEMPCGYGTLKTTGVRIWHLVSRRACAEVSAASNCNYTNYQSRSILNAPPSLLPVSWARQNALAESQILLATGPVNPPAVRVWTGKTVWCRSRPVQKHDPEHFGGRTPRLYSSTRGFCRVWVGLSVPVSSSPCQVLLFTVAVRYVTVMCKILTLVQHSLYWFHWQPLNSKQGETCSLLHPEVECDQLFILHNV